MVNEVFSISFLPWLLLILAIIIAIPVFAALDAARRKKEFAEANPPSETDQMADEGFSEEVAVVDSSAEEGVAVDNFGNDAFGGNDFGGAFDDDAFK